MSKKFDFDARVVKARKQYKCFACNNDIVVGQVHVAYPGKNDAGVFTTTRLCIICSYLITQKTGAKAHSIRQGEFSDALIPNCLRKKRAEFLKDPKEAVTAAGLMDSKPAPPPKPCQQIVVKTSEFGRRIFHLPESRYKAEQFQKGETLTIKAGVNGKSRAARIIMARSTTGEAFGCNKRQIAVLVA
jgi:hypothetical protein